MIRAKTLQFPKALPSSSNAVSAPASIEYGDALKHYDKWPSPTCIIADGPYGLGKFPGEPKEPERLAEWYAPHAAAWARHSSPITSLWFWNSEIGWAKAHPALELNGWIYEETIVWDKGIGHIAGNCNSKTIRGVPVVTEISVRYSRKAELQSDGDEKLELKDWLRSEWLRSGLPMNQANSACGVANAATRKYLTQCHLWYFPPGEAVVSMASWCRKYGRRTSVPYFSIDRVNPITVEQWDRMRTKWNHTHGMTNVWQEPAVHGPERIKLSTTAVAHANQKPLRLMERQILASTDPLDVVWEPFGGLCSATLAAALCGRRAYAAEINRNFFTAAANRLAHASQVRLKGLA